MHLLILALVIMFVVTLISIKLPLIYDAVKLSVLAQNEVLSNSQFEVKIKPFIAVAFSLFSLLIYYITADVKISIFSFLFSCVAYTDLMVRWVPDFFIYSMAWVSILGVNQSYSDGMVSVLLFCFPAALLSFIYYIYSRKWCIASGDWYVFPSIGIWIAPQYAAIIMLISIGVALLVSRYIKEVPFLTCVFPVFIGGQICEVYLKY